ncbi:DUG2 [Symbiodinium sp. CCMP2592]|nr:DUG2 [Symbiodinium sp. CCMP2592]
MCRMCALISDDNVLLADVLLRPRMSLVHQSYAARERRALPQGVSPSMAYQQPCLNADGFGVGWYAQQAPIPCVFTSLKPAWNDPNLRNLSEEVRSPLIFAHIRAAGPSSSVNEAACHPFKAGRFLFAHNGLVGNFSQIRRQLLAGLNEYAFSITLDHSCIDSVVAFGIFLTELGVSSDEDATAEHSADEMCGALSRTVLRLTQAAAEYGPEESLLNLMVTDGQRIVACRYGTAPAETQEEGQEVPLGATLYLSVGSRWVASLDDPQTYRMKKGADIKSCTAILSSEPLTHIREEWLPIAPNSIVLCGRTRGEGQAIDTLMFPLKCGPVVGLSALTGVESAPKATKNILLGESQEGLNEIPDTHQDIWMSITATTDSGDVNCLATLSDSLFVAGSMDGSLRFFDSDEGQALAVRHHSQASGPVLSLLFIRRDNDSPGSSHRGDESPLESLGSPADSALASPRSPTEAGPLSFGRTQSEDLHSRSMSAGCLGAAAKLKLNEPEILASRVPKATSLDLLLSTSINELRVWDVTALLHAEEQSDDDTTVPCLFCFHFAPNQGHLLSIAGSLQTVILGFQSTNLFCLRLLEGWTKLLQAKTRTRTTRHYTFNIDLAKKKPNTPPGPNKFSHHSLLELWQSCNQRHMGFVHCVVQEPLSGIVASGGGDGRIVFWEKGKAICCFNHGGPVLALAACATSKALYSGDAYGRIRVWDAASVQHGSKAVLSSGGGCAAAILALATLGDQNLTCEGPPVVISGDAAGSLRLWDAERGTLLRELLTGASCCAAVSPLGMRLSSSSSSGGRYALRVVTGGCNSGTIHAAYLDVNTGTKTSRPMLSPPSRVCGRFCRKKDCGHEDAVEFQRLVTLLGEFVAFQTVSSDSRHEPDMQKAASWLARRFEELLGATVRICNGAVVARCGWDLNKPLVIMYSHYDVVAAGKGWHSDPWTMRVEDGYFYGRGVSDNKGPLLAQIFAVRRLLQHSDSSDFCLAGFDLETTQEEECPVNVLFIVDGHEESGDPSNTLRVVREARSDGWLRGKTVGLIVNNSSWIDDERPCLCYGMRGVLDLEVAIQGGERDLHSGVNGGLLPEPTFDLMSLISSLTDATGVPTVAGLSESLCSIQEEDLVNLSAAGQQMSVEKICQRLGIPNGHAGPGWLQSFQNPGMEALKRTWLQPSISITEIGKGPRHLHGRHIANRASCVVSVRTTPGQKPEDVVGCLKQHLQHEFAKRRSCNKLEIAELAVSESWLAKPTSKVFRAARAAVATAWKLEESAVLAVREGGTIAILPLLEAELECDVVQMAFSQASDAVHLPNERMSRTVLARAVDAIAGTLSRLADAAK